MWNVYFSGMAVTICIVLITIRHLQKKDPDDKEMQNNNVNTFILIFFSLAWPLVLLWLVCQQLIKMFKVKKPSK